jgi:hypothetical protein
MIFQGNGDKNDQPICDLAKFLMTIEKRFKSE